MKTKRRKKISICPFCEKPFIPATARAKDLVCSDECRDGIVHVTCMLLTVDPGVYPDEPDDDIKAAADREWEELRQMSPKEVLANHQKLDRVWRMRRRQFHH